MTFHKTKQAAVVLFILTGSATQAPAAIWCDGEYQIVSGYPVATPFCENHLLAQVARSYGARTSTDFIANSLSEKRQICNFVGHDARVDSICAPYRNGPGGHDRK